MALTYDEIKTQVDFEMLKKLAKGLNVFPSQLFTFEEIKKDREFKELHETLTEYKNLKKDNENYQKEKEDFEKKVKEFTDKENLSTAKERFGEFIKGLKNESEKIFIEKKFDIDKPLDLTDEGLKNFVKLKQDEYKLIEPVFKKDNTPIFQPEGTPPVDTEDMTKVANNPLLEEDFNPYQR